MDSVQCPAEPAGGQHVEQSCGSRPPVKQSFGPVLSVTQASSLSDPIPRTAMRSGTLVLMGCSPVRSPTISKPLLSVALRQALLQVPGFSTRPDSISAVIRSQWRGKGDGEVSRTPKRCDYFHNKTQPKVVWVHRGGHLSQLCQQQRKEDLNWHLTQV